MGPGVPLRFAVAVPDAASGTDQSWALANMSLCLHLPQVPVWSCVACGLPWPCRSARLRLLAEYDGAPTSLSIYLGACMVAAATDLGELPARQVYSRFLGWHRSAGG